jgi:hypothetical protein
MVRIVCGNAGRLGDLAFISVGLCDFESDAARLARGDDFVILAGRSPARRVDSLDLEVLLTFVLDFNRVGERRARLD